MPSDPLPEPWRSFLRDLDKELVGPTELHCFGGFVVAQCHGLTRPTADIDVLESQGTDLFTLAKLAGRTSPLYKRHGVYMRLRIFERHDLVLTKIVRNNDRDRADVAAIAGGPGLDIDVLRDRYLELKRAFRGEHVSTEAAGGSNVGRGQLADGRRATRDD